MILLSFIFFVYFPVENDPHFIIYLPKSQKNICFNIDSEPGKILNLVSDPELGKIKIYYIEFNYYVTIILCYCFYLDFFFPTLIKVFYILYI